MPAKPDLAKPIMVIGGGVAGITAALDLAKAGTPVHLVEKSPHLGGLVSSLDKLYPTDHCAFCPLWTEVRNCMQHPLITIHTCSEITSVVKKNTSLSVILEKQPRYIDEKRCILCARCVPLCSVDAIRPPAEHVYPSSYYIDLKTCTKCGDCVDICPSSAIDITRQAQSLEIAVRDIIWATGLQDFDISGLEEYGYGTHPDIVSSLEFENWTAEAGPNRGTIRKKCDHEPPKSIAFIQCAGARDLRLFPYCSAVCCMHALKQAQWVKRRSHEIGCVIFYTDMRAEGRYCYEYYLREISGSAIELIRGRPGLIYPMPEGAGIAVKYEDTYAQAQKIRVFDMVVLNGALKPSLAIPGQNSYSPILNDEGLLIGTSSAPKACGFCREPADVESSVIHASSAALRAHVGEDKP